VTARVFLPAISSGILLWLAFFPVDAGPIAFVAMVPWLTLVRAEGVGRVRRYLAAFLGGLVFSVLALKWIRVAHPMMALFAWPALSIYCALYWPVALGLLRRLDRLGQPSLALTFPIVWVALEYFRTHFPTGFPPLAWLGAYQLIGFGWYALGYTQHAILPLLQAADLGGVYVISAAVAAVNGAIYEWLIRLHGFRWLCRWPQRHPDPEWLVPAVISSLIFGCVLVLMGYGLTRLDHEPFDAGPRVHVLQGNLPQNEKMIRGEQLPENGVPPLEQEYTRLAAEAYGDGIRRRPDLIVWPETCFAQDWYDLVPEIGSEEPDLLARKLVELEQHEFRELLRRRYPPANLLLGLNRREFLKVWPENGRFRHESRRYNSAILLRDDSERSFAASYDKIHLVPFGEYVPLKEWFPWLQQFTPYDHEYSCTPGDRLTRFPLVTARGTFSFGVLICYEDSDPYLARQYNPAAGGEPTDFLINMSNDGWFDGTEEHEQHLAICRFRAVEARRSVVRAVNMGISAVIDPDGRVIALPGDTWSSSKKMAGIVRAEVPIDRRRTVYAAAGDWLPALLWCLLLYGLILVPFARPPSLVQVPSGSAEAPEPQLQLRNNRGTDFRC
jgi:apolipoprotein N-acyltransferase